MIRPMAQQSTGRRTAAGQIARRSGFAARWLAATLACGSTPALAQVRVVPEQPETAAAAQGGVDVILLNQGGDALPAAAPAEIAITARDGTPIRLARSDAGAAAPIPARGFAVLRYLPLPGAAESVRATTPTGPRVALAPAAPEVAEATMPSSAGAASAILGRFRPYEPSYIALGRGKAGAKVQASVAFQPFAARAPAGLGHLRLAYTQTMFWAVNERSAPMRTTTYSPEVFATVPVDSQTRIDFGFRHDSNGAGVGESVSMNRVMLRAIHRFDLGEGWRIDVAPQAWLYVGRLPDTRPLPDYLGWTGISASLQREDGPKLAIAARGNPDTGRGSIELFASHPLAGLGGGLGLYVFGQFQTGHGEALADFDRRTTHARIGFALTR